MGDVLPTVLSSANERVRLIVGSGPPEKIAVIRVGGVITSEIPGRYSDRKLANDGGN